MALARARARAGKDGKAIFVCVCVCAIELVNVCKLTLCASRPLPSSLPADIAVNPYGPTAAPAVRAIERITCFTWNYRGVVCGARVEVYASVIYVDSVKWRFALGLWACVYGMCVVAAQQTPDIFRLWCMQYAYTKSRLYIFVVYYLRLDGHRTVAQWLK